MRRKLFRILLFFFVIVSTSSVVKAQDASLHLRPAAKLISEHKKQFGDQLSAVPIFIHSSIRDDEAGMVLNKFTSLTLDSMQLSSFMNVAAGGIEMDLPYENSTITVELVKVNLLTADFKVLTDKSNGSGVPYKPGLFYRGIVKGDDNSLVSFSFFDHEVAGIISRGNENIVVGKMHNGISHTNHYIIYSDRDFISPHTTSCSTIDDPVYASTLLQNIATASTLRTTNCVRLYYEIDNNIFQNCGSNIADATNWVLAIQNNIASLYANDDITVALSEIFIWTFADPYTAGDAVAQLNNFKTFRASFNGDVGQLLSIEPGSLGGIASVVNAFCSDDDKYCYSDVDYTYSSVPTYSWTVNVIAHEFGHLMGSYHTHNCLWPGGAIDDCGPIAGYPNEGGTCPLGPDPINGGTIMSYCHLTSFGINFNNGFGPLPASAIQGAVDEASCLSPSCVPNPASYCNSSGKTSGEWIQSVQVNEFINNSGQGPGYSDFTNQTIDLTPGSVVTITLSPGYPGTHYKEYFSVWIDYNKDLNFYGATENVYQSAASNVPTTSTFVVPIGLTGTTRMRISMKFDTLASSCESFKYGEVEDYTISFSPPVSYCASYGMNASKEWIDYVDLGTINRSSGSDGGYFDGTGSSTSMTLNSSNTLTYSAGFESKRFNEYWKVWIDYNGNGDFEASEKVVDKTSNKKGNISKTFSIPATASIGKTRMRISMKRHDVQTCCEIFTHGEVEDYSVLIIPQDLAPPESNFQFSAIVYPNPASDQITVSFSEFLTNGHADIFDLAGRKLKTAVIPESAASISFPVADLPPGIYLLSIMAADNRMSVQKWIKQ